MPPRRPIRRSRRLSHKSPMEAADYDWQGVAVPLQLLHSGSDVAIIPSAIERLPSSPSASDSPPSIVTHLPFAPGSSHTRNRKEGHIPRPPNAFMIFRSWLWNKDNLKNIERDNRNVSRIAGRYWNELTEAERVPFRAMAEEAKARHAQLYPEYKYAPGSQKRAKVVQRRSQRSVDAENEKCKKLADLLLGGVTTHDLTKYLDEGHKNVKHEEDTFALTTEETSSGAPSRKTFKRPAPRRDSPPPRPKTKKQRTCFPSPSTTPQCDTPLPTILASEDDSEDMDIIMSTPRPLVRTPELVYPLGEVEEFVATDDIPYLSLDDRSDLTIKNDTPDDLFSLPSHLKPGAHTVLTGIKPEAVPFADSCILGAYTAQAPFSPVLFTNCDESLVPLGPVMFTNPFEPSTPSAGHALFGTLDQLFPEPISPLTLAFPKGDW